MNWLTNFVRPKLRALVRKRDLPDKLWIKCQSCGQMLHHKAMAEAQYVCGHCDHHMRIGPKERFRHLFDDGAHTTIEVPEVLLDPLRFRDERRYADRLKEVRGQTGQEDAVVVAHGLIGGHATVMAVQNFKFLGGSMGMAAGEALIASAQLAVLQDATLVVVTAAGGARMQEGILSLMQMPRTTIAVQTVREKGLPYIVVLTDPTTGGVTASYAMLGDIAIAEPGALIGFAGPRVIENTIREQLPEGFQRAEYLLEHGMLDMVVHRHQLRESLARIIDMLKNPAPPAEMVTMPQTELEIPEPEAATDAPSAEA
jgi:acetyl-CoA carboxylase carboxyl transferase subunit beta